MRNGQNNKRMRGRNNNNQQHHHHRNKGQNPMVVFESNGPDVKIRGNPSHIAEKYIQLARDAQSSGDPVSAENYYQHAEHYNRLIAAAQEQFRQQNPQFNNRPETDMRSDMRDDTFDDGEDDAAGDQSGGNQSVGDQSMQGGGDAPFGQGEPQPYLPREAQPFPHQQQPQQQPQQPSPRQSQPGGQEAGDVDRLPSFITGGQPPNTGSQPPSQGFSQNGHDGQPDRFPLHRRRRRHRGPRGDFQGGQRDDAPPQD